MRGVVFLSALEPGDVPVIGGAHVLLGHGAGQMLGQRQRRQPREPQRHELALDLIGHVGHGLGQRALLHHLIDQAGQQDIGRELPVLVGQGAHRQAQVGDGHVLAGDGGDDGGVAFLRERGQDQERQDEAGGA